MRLRTTRRVGNSHGPMKTLAALIAAMFASTAAPAFDWSASDLSTQYQDSGGTLPVTGVEQPVGLVLDRAKGGAKRGPEMVTNGDFTSGLTGWTTPSTAPGTVTAVNGAVKIDTSSSTGGIARLRQAGWTTVAGAFYEIVFQVSDYVGVASNNLMQIGTTAGGADLFSFSIPSNGTFRLLFRANTTASHLSFYVANDAGVQKSFTLDNVSCKQVTGPNLWQGTPAVKDANWTDNGDGSFTSNGSNGLLGWTNLNPKLSIGRTYECIIRVTARTAGQVTLPYDGAGSNNTNPSASPGTFRRIITATATSLYIYSTGFNGTVDSIYIAEIPGNHLIQPTSASRPTLSARVNLLTYSEQISHANWAKSAGGTGTAPTVTDNFGVAPDGTTTAARVQMALNGGTTSADISRLLQSITGMPVGGSYSQGLWLKTNDGSTKVIQFRDDNSATVGKNITVTGAWQYFSQDSTASAGSTTVNAIGLWLRGTQSTADSADLLMWHPQFNYGPLQRYQRIAAATDYDTVGFAKGWRFDGVDDGFYTPAVFDWSTTDKLTIIAAVRKLSDASLATIAELGPSTSGTNGSWLLCAPSGTNSATFGMFARGTIYGGVSPAGFPAPYQAGVIATTDIGASRLSLSADGGPGLAVTYNMGTGNFASQVLYVGRRSNSTLAFPGVIYSLRGFGRLVSPDERGWLLSQGKLDMNNNL